jgi:CRP/FNR family transcriptional regulator
MHGASSGVEAHLMTQHRAPPVRQNPLELAAGDCVYRCGDAAAGLFRIRAGRVRLVAPHEGRERLVALLGPGDVFGDVVATVEGERSTRAETARCDVATTLSLMEPFGQGTHEPPSAELVDALLADRRVRSRRLRLLCFENVENRLAGVLGDLAERVGEPCRHGASGRDLTCVTQEDLADLVGSSRAFVSTILNKFKRDGDLAAIGRVLCLRVAGRRAERAAPPPATA